MSYNRWMPNELLHYGVKGMKWGVRKQKMTYSDYYRVQSTLSGKERDQYNGYSYDDSWYQSKKGRKREHHDTKYYTKLAKEYKKRGKDRMWNERSDRFATSLRDKKGSVMGFVIGQDSQSWHDSERYINIAIAITKKHRGTYVSKRLVDEGKTWLNKHPEYTELRWYAVKENVASRKLAEKSGFERAPQYDTDYDAAYTYKRKT